MNPRTRLVALLSLLLGLAACADPEPTDPSIAPPCASPAPLERAKEGGVDGTWVVTLDAATDDLDAAADALAERHGFEVEARLFIARSFVTTMSEPTLADVRCDPSVERVTQDRTTRALAD
jgi:hypothetical protein